MFSPERKHDALLGMQITDGGSDYTEYGTGGDPAELFSIIRQVTSR